MFISFEGPDGAGKTTQIELLVKRLQAEGYRTLATREPGGTPIGSRLRAILLDREDVPAPETEALLMSADRAEHVRKVIRPALGEGTIVVSDRYLDSTLAYQGGGRGLDMDALRSIQMFATGGLVPDLTVLLDIPVEDGLTRKRQGQALNRLDREAISFHRRVASTFRQLSEQEPERWLCIDATQNIEMVHTAIWSHVTARLQESHGALIKGGSS